MKFNACLRRLLSRTSIYFTLITAVYVLLSMMVNVGEQETLLAAKQILFHALFSLLASGAWELYCLKSLAAPLRLIIHYGILIFAFYTCFLLPAEMTGAQVFVGVIAFTLVYGAVMGLRSFFRARFSANVRKVSVYDKQYSKKN